MITMKKKIIIFALVLTILGVGIANNSRVFAQNTKPNPFSSLVQIISDKFGLNKNDVQSIFDQYTLQLRQNRGQKMIDKQKSRLDQLVQQGKITTAQEQSILDELAALKIKYNSGDLKNMTPSQRKQQFQAMQEEIKSWAKSQGVNLSYILSGFGRWHKPSPTP